MLIISALPLVVPALNDAISDLVHMSESNKLSITVATVASLTSLLISGYNIQLVT